MSLFSCFAVFTGIVLLTATKVSKKLVSSDYKNNRVTNPNTITPKQIKAVKKYTKEFFDKAVIKHREHEARKRAKAAARIKSAARGQK